MRRVVKAKNTLAPNAKAATMARAIVAKAVTSVADSPKIVSRLAVGAAVGVTLITP
jgi:DNA-binding phage protein